MSCDGHGVGPGTPIVIVGDGVNEGSIVGEGVKVSVGGVV